MLMMMVLKLVRMFLWGVALSALVVLSQGDAGGGCSGGIQYNRKSNFMIAALNPVNFEAMG